MFDLDDIRDGIDDLIENRPVVFYTSVFIILLFLAGLVVLMIQTSGKKSTVKYEDQNFSADAPIIIPDPPNPEKDYYQFRTTKDAWGKDELERWFSYPDGAVMEQLEKANDRLVDDLTGAAP